MEQECGLMAIKFNSTPYVGFSGFDRLNFSSESLGLPLYGNTKQVQYYNSALTDSELEQLTSWELLRYG